MGSLRRAAVAVLLAFSVAGAPAMAQMKTDGSKFLDAVKKRDGATIDELLSKPGTTLVNSKDLTTGRTALHIAVDMRDVQWVRFLARRGVNPNIADVNGVTPLMRASQMGFIEGVQALVDSGARVDDPNDTGETPLVLAVHRKDTAMMRILLEAGADPDRGDNSGRTARDYARADGANSLTLMTIQNSKAPVGAHTPSGQVYGPSF